MATVADQGMHMVEFKDVYFEYGTHAAGQPSTPAVNGITESIREGEFVVVLGRNGSGKSTMARLMNALLLPTGGTVWVDGMNTAEGDKIWEIRRTLGMVFQNPDNQLVATTVEEDLAFGPENLGLDPSEIRRRIDAAARYVGMEEHMKHSPHMLSGGQKQRVAIAGILAMEPKCIVLDESTSMLDPRGRKEVIDLIRTLNREKGITIILITHHMEEAVHADRVLVMDRGRIAMQGTPREIFSRVDELKKLGLSVPQVTQLMHELKAKGLVQAGTALTLEEAEESLKAVLKKSGFHHPALQEPAVAKEPAEVIVSIRDLSHTYMPGTTFERKALQEVSLDIMKGEILGIIGHTGSGKSTLVQHLNGLLKPTSGSVTVDGLECGGKSPKELRQKVGLIFQYPEHQLFEETVYKDIIFGLSRLGLPQDEIERRVKCVLDIIGLSEELLWKSPFELSGGQKRRVAIAGVLVMEPEILVLDEPTAGLDPRGSEEVFAILTELNRTQGTTILIISHSMEQIAAYCDRIAVLNRGRLEMLDTPRKVFSQEDRLRSLGLDIPEITRLFRNLHRAGYPVNGHVLTISEAVRSISETMLAKETHKGGNNA